LCRIVLCCLVLSCVVLWRLVLSCVVLFCPVSPCAVLCRLTTSCLGCVVLRRIVLWLVVFCSGAPYCILGGLCCVVFCCDALHYVAKISMRCVTYKYIQIHSNTYKDIQKTCKYIQKICKSIQIHTKKNMQIHNNK